RPGDGCDPGKHHSSPSMMVDLPLPIAGRGARWVPRGITRPRPPLILPTWKAMDRNGCPPGSVDETGSVGIRVGRTEEGGKVRTQVSRWWLLGAVALFV